MSSDSTGSDPLRLVLLVLAVVVGVPLVMMLVAVPMMGFWGAGGMMGSGPMDGVRTPLWLLFGTVLPLLLLVGLGYLAYRVLASDGGMAGRDRAMEELRLAYARGDLTDDEFEERRDRLRREG